MFKLHDNDYYPHFTNEEMEVQSTQHTASKGQSKDSNPDVLVQIYHECCAQAQLNMKLWVRRKKENRRRNKQHRQEKAPGAGG